MAQRFSKKDVSTSLRNSESGMVDQVMLSTNAEGQRFVKLRVRAPHEPDSPSPSGRHAHNPGDGLPRLGGDTAR